MTNKEVLSNKVTVTLIAAEDTSLTKINFGKKDKKHLWNPAGRTAADHNAPRL